MADIFSDALNFVGSTLKQIATGDSLKDYSHANKLFVGSQFRLVPKNGFLFHVFFDINTDVAYADPTNPLRNNELGLLIKSAALPKFNIDTKTYNAYNRPNIVQTKLKYETLTLTFHDDSADVVRNFWFDYYNYYYRDSDYQESLYSTKHKYNKTRATSAWGFTPRNASGAPYLKSIRIYSLHQKRFSEYVLINPIIKSFSHGEHAQGANETLTHSMTVEFETVLYYYGATSSNTVKGFADLHYDKSPSPLTPAGGGTRSILGTGGLLETADDAIYDLSQGNYGSALFKASRGLQNMSAMDLKSAGINELLGLGTSVLRGNNPTSSIFVPSLSGLASSFSGIGGAGGNWLAGAATAGAAYLSGKAIPRSQEVTQATAFEDGYPAGEEDGLPWPDEIAAYAETAPQPNGTINTINNSSDYTAPTNQSSFDAVAQKQSAQNNMAVISPAITSAKSDISFNQRQYDASREAEATFNNKIAALKADGATDDSVAVKNLTSLANQEIVNQSNRLQKITELSNTVAGLTDKQAQEQSKINGAA